MMMTNPFRRDNNAPLQPQPDDDTIVRLADLAIATARSLDVDVRMIPSFADTAYDDLDRDIAEPHARAVYELLRMTFRLYHFRDDAFDTFQAMLHDKLNP